MAQGRPMTRLLRKKLERDGERNDTGSATENESTSPTHDSICSSVTSSAIYKPTIFSTAGQRPASLVRASVNFVGDNKIYAIGGLNPDTDEVFNHVLCLDLSTGQWGLVDNYGDVPKVRMSHTANLWQGKKLIVFGGQDEYGEYHSDVIVFDVETATWTAPDAKGPVPTGRARHSAVIDDEKLFIFGGLSGSDNRTILEDICYLDLTNWTWSEPFEFTSRFDHYCWIRDGQFFTYGGITVDFEQINMIGSLDLKHSPNFNDRSDPQPSDYYGDTAFQIVEKPPEPAVPEESSSDSRALSNAQETVSATEKARKGWSLYDATSPVQTDFLHFPVYYSGYLLDFVTSAAASSHGTSLGALDLETMRWKELARAEDSMIPNYRWHYCTSDPEGTNAWLLGCPSEVASRTYSAADGNLSSVLPIDLSRLRLLRSE